MKQETSEVVMQNTIQEKNCKPEETLNIKYFYNLFIKTKKRYPESYFAIDKKINKKRKRFIALKEYKKIIYSYLKIYFTELYMANIPKYFFLGGKMKIVRYSTWVNKQPKGHSKELKFCKADNALGLFWFLRPSKKTLYMVKIKKLTGSTNAIPQIEKRFNQIHNKDLLPIFTEERKKGMKHKTLFKCIQT